MVSKKSAPSSTLSGIEAGAEIFPYLNFSPVEARDLLCSAQHNIDLLSRLCLSNVTWFLDLLYLDIFTENSWVIFQSESGILAMAVLVAAQICEYDQGWTLGLCARLIAIYDNNWSIDKGENPFHAHFANPCYLEINWFGQLFVQPPFGPVFNLSVHFP